MKIKELTDFLEQWAPLSYQESYDNAGLIVGDAQAEISGVLLCLDSTEAVIDEAAALGCNLVIAHHPIIFKGLKRITGATYIERVIIKAIRRGISIYAIHTNLDHMYHQGVNSRIAEQLGLQNTQVLAPRQELKKLSAMVPALHQNQIEQALIRAGARQVAFTHQTTYSAYAHHDNNGLEAEYLKLEALFSSGRSADVLRALQQSQPNQELGFDVVAVETPSTEVGAGLIGKLPEAMSEPDFLDFLREQMKTRVVRHTRLLGRPVQKVAVCGGSGSFLLPRAIAKGADVFVTADFKYHEFFDADERLVIADIGHFESEQFTIDLLYQIISKKFSNFAAYCTKVNTNPVNYWY